MGFFSGGSTTSTSDSYSGLRGTKQFKPLINQIGSGFQTGMDFAKGRLADTNPFGLGANGLTGAQMDAFNTLGKNLFSGVSSNYASRGFLSPENISGVVGSSLTQAAPQLLQQVFQNQVANESAMTDRFGALKSLLDTGTGLAGNETHSTSVTKGPNLLGQAVSGWANPAQLGSFMSGLGDLAKGGAAAGVMCWIAEALFGVNDVRTHCARWYVNHILPQSLAGRLFRLWYAKYGQDIAKRIPASPILRIVLTPLFTHFANSGARYFVSRVA